jgi:hypothetical protein
MRPRLLPIANVVRVDPSFALVFGDFTRSFTHRQILEDPTLCREQEPQFSSKRVNCDQISPALTSFVRTEDFTALNSQAESACSKAAGIVQELDETAAGTSEWPSSPHNALSATAACLCLLIAAPLMATFADGVR